MPLIKKTLLLFWLLTSLSQAANILPADKVFIPQIESVNPHKININIDIKPQYYLYRDRLFSVKAASDNWAVTDVKLSKGSQKDDEFFGTQSVWYGGKDIANLSITYVNPKQLLTGDIVLNYQGCQDGVICYPPISTTLPITFPSKGNLATSDKTDTPKSNNTPVTGHVAVNTLPSSSGLFRKPSTPTSSANNIDSLFATSHKQKLSLTEDEAFPFVVTELNSTTYEIRWKIAEKHYLYRNKFNITAQNANIAKILYSPGLLHHDEFYGQQEIYRSDNGVATVYLKKATDNQSLAIAFQGCADKGICYPVTKRTIILNSRELHHNQAIELAASDSSSKNNDVDTELSLVDSLTEKLKSNIWLGVGALLLAGIALALTPCVLPMLPILLGILSHRGALSKGRTAVLSSTYVVGMATTLALVGLIVAKTGVNIQIIFQKPLWLILFAAIFIVMGLAMLGVFSIAMPNNVQKIATRLQSRFGNNRIIDVFIVGALSSLVVGPCIAPPLVAILAFIATTNDSVLGALYLFSLGIGMGLPLIIFATVVTQVPKTGEFSLLVTKILAMLMFGVGLWLLARLIPGYIGLIIAGIWLFIIAYLFWKSRFITAKSQQITKLLAAICLAISLMWVIGGLMGNSNPLSPFSTVKHLPFKNINTLDELKAEIKNSEKPVMLDLYADWCVACQEVEHYTLTDANVISSLGDWKLLKLDITDTNDEHRKILAELGLIGPPAMLFYRNGEEVKTARNVGTIDAKTLLKKLKSIK